MGRTYNMASPRWRALAGAACLAAAVSACEGDGGVVVTPDAVGDAPAAPTLCDKYGGPGVVATVVQSFVIPEIAGDCRISAYFTGLSADGLGHVVECLTVQVQELFGCAGVTYAGSTDSRGVVCRSMAEAHVGLQLSQGDFDALIDDVVVALTKAGVEEADINAAAPALLGMQGDIVAQPTIAEPTAPVVGAGGEVCE